MPLHGLEPWTLAYKYRVLRLAGSVLMTSFTLPLPNLMGSTRMSNEWVILNRKCQNCQAEEIHRFKCKHCVHILIVWTEAPEEAFIYMCTMVYVKSVNIQYHQSGNPYELGSQNLFLLKKKFFLKNKQIFWDTNL